MARQPDLDDLVALANNLPQLCWLAGPDGAIDWYNERWMHYTGLNLEEMQGWGWKQVHDPAYVDQVTERFVAAIQSGTAWEDTFPLRRHDGEWRWFLSRAMPVRDQAGDIRRWIGTNTDVTDVRDQERELRTKERRYRSLVEASAQIVWRADSNGVLLGTGSRWRQFTGQTPAEIAQLGWLDAIHPEDRELTMASWQQAAGTGQPYALEHRMRRADGQWRYMQVRSAPVIDDSGHIAEWVGTHTDITERKRIEIELQRAKDEAVDANLAKSQFIANMSHELRTPLSAVIGYSEMLEEEVEEAGVGHLLDDLRKINEAARHLLAMISDVLDLSKIEANRMTVYPETFSVEALLKSVGDTVQSLIVKKNNRLVFDTPISGGMHTDQVKLRQCLFNLLGNAAKFTSDGTITLHARRFTRDHADWVEFAVEDSGIGMSEEALSKLFKRFVQADDSTTRRYGGTGLGLSITRAFVELMGGEVDVRSEEGHGSTFTLRVPVELPEQPADTIADAVETPAPGDSVLIIDDDANTRNLIARCLEREGFTTREAADGRAGLEMARAIRPRVVLLDVMMPQMDGWSVLSAIRADPDLADTPVVMISFVHEEGLAASLGANDYLAKPIEWDDLRLAMSRYRRTAAGGDVLIIDDDGDTRHRLTTMLNRSGFSVRAAASGAAALAMAEQAAPAIILLDLLMPDMDGFVVLKTLRANPAWQNVAIIVLTAKDLTPAERMFLQGEADQVLTKGSTSFRELAEQLRGLEPLPAPA